MYHTCRFGRHVSALNQGNRKDKFGWFSISFKYIPPPLPTNLIFSNNNQIVLYRCETRSLTQKAKSWSAHISQRSASEKTWIFFIIYSYFAPISLYDLQLTHTADNYEWWLGKNVDEKWRGIFSDSKPVASRRDSVVIVELWTGIQTQFFPSKM